MVDCSGGPVLGAWSICHCSLCVWGCDAHLPKGQDALHLGRYGPEGLAFLPGRQHPCRGAKAFPTSRLALDKVADASFMLVFLSIVADPVCRLHGRYGRARRRFGSGMTTAGMLVTMLSRCVHFAVGSPLESAQVQFVDTMMGMLVGVAVQTVHTVWRFRRCSSSSRTLTSSSLRKGFSHGPDYDGH